MTSMSDDAFPGKGATKHQTKDDQLHASDSHRKHIDHIPAVELAQIFLKSSARPSAVRWKGSNPVTSVTDFRPWRVLTMTDIGIRVPFLSYSDVENISDLSQTKATYLVIASSPSMATRYQLCMLS